MNKKYLIYFFYEEYDWFYTHNALIVDDEKTAEESTEKLNYFTTTMERIQKSFGERFEKKYPRSNEIINADRMDKYRNVKVRYERFWINCLSTEKIVTDVFIDDYFRFHPQGNFETVAVKYLKD